MSVDNQKLYNKHSTSGYVKIWLRGHLGKGFQTANWYDFLTVQIALKF